MLDSIQPGPPQSAPHSGTGPVSRKPNVQLRVGLALLMLILLAIGIFFGSKLVILAQKIFEGTNGPISFRQFFLASDKKLIGEDTGEVHILLLGIGGEGHDGPNLTDTMILATLKIPQNSGENVQVGLFSIPRDLVVDIPGHDYVKINSAYAYGQQDGQNQGAQLARKTVEHLLGINIPYYGLLDFAGFKKVIDDIGGITVTVDRTFTDSSYPDEKDGYLPPITFQAGTQKMNGERALEFVRSRHGDNNEGTDFARSRRQQKILQAIKDRVVSLNVLTNLSTLDKLLNDIGDHVRTNLQPYEMKRIYDLTRGIKDTEIATHALDVESGILCNQIAQDTGAYILVPCTGLTDYSAIRSLLANQFASRVLQVENASIELQNASGNVLLTGQVQNKLLNPSLNLSTGPFRGGIPYSQSIIYDNTGGAKPNTLNFLETTLGLPAASGPYPFVTATANPDFVIVIASDLKAKLQ